VEEGPYKRAVGISVIFHVLLVLFFTFGIHLFPSPEPITLGLGEGGGQPGDFVSVGLAADTGGGEGMYKPPVTPRADSAPPPPPKPKETVPEEVPATEDVFVEEKKPVKKPEPKPPTQAPPKPKPKAETQSQDGLIPREPDPGRGPRAGGGGTGGGFGSGRGVSIGSGQGQDEGIESWYIRQVEQRVGQNWLQTSLGQLERRVQAVASFVVNPTGRITDIELEKSSGIRSVDLAVQRAIQASNPLPKLPYELRGRTVKFQAVFEYPPR
jgi:TonB family protein